MSVPIERRDSQWSVTDALQLSWPRVADALVSREARSRVADACRWLPAALTTGVYLECRLGRTAEAGRRADVIIHVTPDDAEIIAGTNPVLALPPALLDHHAWRLLQRFCRAWRAPDTRWRPLVEHLWLEFDIAPPITAATEPTVGHAIAPLINVAADTGAHSMRESFGIRHPVPSLFVGLRPGLRARADARPLARCIREIRTLLLNDGASMAAPEPALQAALQAAPPEAEVPYAGFMLARQETACRLYLMHLRPDAWEVYLQLAGWPGAVGELADRFRPLIDPDDARRVSPIGMGHVDVGPYGVGARVGFEFTCVRRQQRHPDGPLARLLRRATEHALCTPAQARALRAWPGGQRAQWPQQLWDSVVVRHVHCVKLVLDPGRRPEVKAYLLTRALPAGQTVHSDRQLYPVEPCLRTAPPGRAAALH